MTRCLHRRVGVLVLLCVVVGAPAGAQEADGPALLEVRKIWDEARHSAFTDLIRFQGRWFCVFREADSHVGGQDGRIRVLTSDEGHDWTSAALIEEAGVVTLPGTEFGQLGQGYQRLSVCATEEEVTEGIRRLEAYIHNQVRETD